jgi:hypothetical protein
MNNPWDIPSGLQGADGIAEIIYSAVGRALSQWEKLEFALARLSANLAGHTLPSAVAFGAYRAATIFTQRADDIEKAFEKYIIRSPDQNLEGDFKDLICDIRRLSARRNDIAHGVVQPCWEEKEAVISDKTAVGYVLMPPGYDPRKFAADGKPSYIFGSADIDRYRRSFKEYRAKVIEFGRHLGTRPPS